MSTLEEARGRSPPMPVRARLKDAPVRHRKRRRRGASRPVRYALPIAVSGGAAAMLLRASGTANPPVAAAITAAAAVAAFAAFRYVPRIRSRRRRLSALVESLNYIGLIAVVLASGGTFQKALEVSASDAGGAYNRRLRGALLLARNGVSPEKAALSSFRGDPLFSGMLPYMTEVSISDPKRLIEAWRREARSAISLVEDISSIFTAMSSILPIISAIVIAILGHSGSYLFFAILPLQLLLFWVIRWWLGNVTMAFR
jgi:Flp pilus assembly protein TadB